MGRLGLSVLMVGVFLSAESEAKIAFEPVLQHYPTGAAAKIAITKDKLAIASSAYSKFIVYDVKDLKKPLLEVERKGLSSITSDENGWIATCSLQGAKIDIAHVDHLNDPNWTFDIDLFHEVYLEDRCLDLAIGKNEKVPDFSEIYFSDVGKGQLHKYEFSGSPLKHYSPIHAPGPLSFAVGNLFTTVKGSKISEVSPLVLNLKSQNSVIGNREGESAESKGKSDYVNKNFYDRVTDSVYYFRPQVQTLYRVSASKPEVSTSEEIRISNDYPRAMSRYGKCLLVMGTANNDDPNDPMPPKWTVIRNPQAGDWTELRSTPFYYEEDLRGAYYQQVDSEGRVYVGGLRGVTRVTGLFEGLDCAL